MVSTKIEFAFSRIGRIQDLADLAELLFPGNRNQQHACLVIWISLKWSADRIVPNLADLACRHGVSRRTFERVRAKMQRMGMIERVSRFNSRSGHRDGWALSGRLERTLEQLARKVAGFRDVQVGAEDKDVLMLRLVDARRTVEHEDPDL